MKQFLIFLIFLNLTTVTFSQKTEYNFFETKKGEKIKLHGDSYKFTAQYFFYSNENGKEQKIAQKKIKYIDMGRKYYFRDKIGSTFGFKRLHELICQNKKYRLSQYFSNGMFYLYLFDKEKEKYAYKKERIKGKTKADKKLFNKKIKPYFSECEELISKINSNLSREYKPDFFSLSYSQSELLFAIYNYNCE